MRLFYLVSIVVMLRKAFSFKNVARMGTLGVGIHVSTHQTRFASASVDLSTSNPLMQKSPTNQLPLFRDIKAEHVEPAIGVNLKRLKEDFQSLETVLRNPQEGESWGSRRIEFDYAGVVEKMEKIQEPLSFSWGVVGHLMGVSNSDELRSAHDKMQPEVIQTYQALGQSQPLFGALSALKQRQSVWAQLDEAQRRIVTSSLRSMENSGVGLPLAERELFNKLQLEAAELSTKFSNNVLDATKAFKKLITEKEAVKGLPPSALALAAQQVLPADRNLAICRALLAGTT